MSVYLLELITFPPRTGIPADLITMSRLFVFWDQFTIGFASGHRLLAGDQNR
jgi:hypothetical protein